MKLFRREQISTWISKLSTRSLTPRSIHRTTLWNTNRHFSRRLSSRSSVRSRSILCRGRRMSSLIACGTTSLFPPKRHIQRTSLDTQTSRLLILTTNRRARTKDSSASDTLRPTRPNRTSTRGPPSPPSSGLLEDSCL